MKAVRIIINVVTAIMLAASIVGVGFLACTVPALTHALATVFADDATSPLDRNQLVRVADETRSYSFADHDLLALYQVIYEVDAEYRDAVGYSAASSTSTGFPRIDQVSDKTSLQQLESAFRGASELYCYSQDTIKHLDDCHNVAKTAYPFIAAALILCVAGAVFTGVTGGRRHVGRVLMASGVAVLLCFVALGAWAIVDFGGFFAAFHSLFFSQGSWQFPYDSLLICALPTPFWVGMGVAWFVVALVLSVASIVVGRKLARR